MLGPKLNAVSTYPFLENAEEGFGTRTSLEREADLGNIHSGKMKTHPFQLLYYITYWSAEKLHTRNKLEEQILKDSFQCTAAWIKH